MNIWLTALDLYTHQMLEMELPFSNPFRNHNLAITIFDNKKMLPCQMLKKRYFIERGNYCRCKYLHQRKKRFATAIQEACQEKAFEMRIVKICSCLIIFDKISILYLPLFNTFCSNIN
jgi:hypothetical protein